MHRGGFLESPTIAYETWGSLEGTGDNAILLFTGLSPSAHAASSTDNPAAGWWEDMIGSGLPLDSDKYFIICVNSLGSCFGSTGPASINPATGERYRLSFPVLTLEDVADYAKRQPVSSYRAQRRGVPAEPPSRAGRRGQVPSAARWGA